MKIWQSFTDTENQVLKVKTLINKGNYKRALRIINRTLKKYPLAGPLYTQRANVYNFQGNQSAACRDYNQAKQLYDDDANEGYNSCIIRDTEQDISFNE